MLGKNLNVVIQLIEDFSLSSGDDWIGARRNRCFYFLIDSDKNFVTRMLRENFYRPVTPFISMAYSRSMIFTL